MIAKIHKTVFLFLFICLSFCLHAQKVNDVISKYISFTGGIEKWKEIKSIIMSGTYNYGGMEFPFTSYSKAPDMYKYIVPSGGKYFAQAYNGSKGWKIDGFKDETTKTILTGKAARAMANEADVELESPFVNYEKKGNKVILEGSDSADGKLCFKVKLLKNDGDTETYYFNSANYELIEKQAISKNAELDSSLVNIFYSDYRTVEGVKVPFKSVAKVDDQTILVIIINKVELNKNIPDSEFEP
jgi:hypothetical protein